MGELQNMQGFCYCWQEIMLYSPAHTHAQYISNIPMNYKNTGHRYRRQEHTQIFGHMNIQGHTYIEKERPTYVYIPVCMGRESAIADRRNNITICIQADIDV